MSLQVLTKIDIENVCVCVCVSAESVITSTLQKNTSTGRHGRGRMKEGGGRVSFLMHCN